MYALSSKWCTNLVHPFFTANVRGRNPRSRNGTVMLLTIVGGCGNVFFMQPSHQPCHLLLKSNVYFFPLPFEKNVQLTHSNYIQSILTSSSETAGQGINAWKVFFFFFFFPLRANCIILWTFLFFPLLVLTQSLVFCQERTAYCLLRGEPVY